LFSAIGKYFILTLSSILLLAACSKNGSNSPNSSGTLGNSAPTESEEFWTTKLSAGSATSTDYFATSHAFSYPVPTLNPEELQLHNQGDILFEQHFSEDELRPEYGLGPVFNNAACIGCHNRDGRGSLPAGLTDNSWIKLGNTEALLLKISIENPDDNEDYNLENKFGEPKAVPGYSHQLFQAGSYGLRGETSSDGQAEIWVKLERSSFQYPDGQILSLSKPIFDLRNPYDEYLDSSGAQKSRLWESDVKISPRMGMPMYGLGLLESIPESDILKNSKVDRSNEGVHGTPNYVYDAVKAQAGNPYPLSIGRFGVKASTPSVLQQSMAALNGDIGVTNPLFPVESIFGTKLFEKYLANKPSPLKVEANESIMRALTFYSQTLAVPPRRDIENSDVLAGAKIFSKISCTSCHTPSWQTDSNSSIIAYRNQKIYPYTDMLLHDMGEGLSDKRKDFRATGSQWKTRPLWGIGLTKVVNPRAGFLHDGRASTLEEAIIWHDGEAKYSRDRFADLDKVDRGKLIRFLQSL
jgi:CxxC motif-containing protein (DUF1111 family)